MALQTATNPQTGEKVVLVGDEWKPVAQTATNPKTGGKAYLVGNEWMTGDAPAPVATEVKPSSAETPELEAMQSGLTAADVKAQQPKPKSVLEGKQMPEQEPSPISRGVDPKFVAGVNAQLDSLEADKRSAAIAQLQKRGGIYGQIADAYAAKEAKLNANPESPVNKKLDTRLEARIERKIAQGRGAEGAAPEAAKEAQMGYEEKLPQMTETPEEVARIQEEYGLNPQLHGGEETARVLKRLGAKGVAAGQQGYYGVQRAFADLLGTEDEDAKTKLDNLDFMLKNMGESKSKPVQVIENAASSIIQQAPAMVGGLLTGSEPLVLASMFTQSFGQTYDESRRLGMSSDESLARSAAFAAFEVLGEKVGLGPTLKAIKNSAGKVPLSDLAAYYAKALAKEIPGEELTYAGQFGVDKAHGQNKEAGIKEFISGAIDTAVNTVAQAGMMFGGGAVANRLLRANSTAQQGETEGVQAPPANVLNPLQNAQALAQAISGQTAPATTQTTPEQPAPAEKQQSAPAATQEEQPAPVAETQEEQTAPAPSDIDSMAEQIAIERGIPLKNAKLLAQRRLDEATAAKVDELAEIYVELGLTRKEAKAQAAIDIAKEEGVATTETSSAQPAASTEGATNAGQPIDQTGGVGTGVAGQPNQVKPTEGFGEPAPDGVVPTGENVGSTAEGAGAEQPALTFTTAKGSTYVIDENGRTSRTKKSEGRGQGTTYEPHTALYVQPGDHENILHDMRSGLGANSVRLGYIDNNTFHPIENVTDIPEGAQAFVGVFNKKKGTPVGLYPALTTPELGFHPVEKLYTPDGMSNTHIGNAIVDIQPIQQGAQVGTETPQAVQTTKKGQKQKPAAAGVTPQTEEEKEAAEEQKLKDDYDRAQRIVDRSFSPKKLLKGISLLRAAQQAMYFFRKAKAFGPDFMYLADGVKNSIPALTTTYELTGKMSGMAADFLRAAGLMQKRVDDYLIKNPDKKDLLSRVIYKSTVMRYDPSDTKRKRRSEEMDNLFAELGEDGQKIYVALRDYYRDISDYYNDLLLEMIENLGIDPEEKKNLAVLLRKEYETSKRISPYFPLVRLGDFWVRVGTGEDRELYTFNTESERDEFAHAMAKEFGAPLDELIGEGDFAVGTQLGLHNDSNGNTMLTAIFDAIEKQPTTANDKETATNQKEAMKNVVFQAYLSAMPEQSFRKQFMEREDIPGFSTDIVKNIAHTATRQALQLARLKYTPEMRKSLDEAKRSLKYQPEGYKLLPFVDEAEKRVNAMLTTDHQGALESVVTGINQVSYVWLLSGPATALMDVINVPTRGLAVLSANHPSKSAVLELSKALAAANRITEKRMHKNAEGVPTMLDDPTLSKEMRYAIGELMRSGVTQQTEVESLHYLGAKATDINAGVVKKAAQKIGRGASLATLGFSHYMSKLTREIVFTASYNLSRREGKSPDEAIRIAIAETKEALGDFSVSNRPRYMQGELGRLVFNLKSFLMNTLLFEAVNLKRMIKADSKEEQVAAAKKFLGLWATTALALGQPATPLYTVIMSALGVVFELLKADDWPEDMKAMNFELWYRTKWIPEHLGDGLGGFMNHGLLGYTGWDLTYRASLDVVKQIMDWSQSLIPPGASAMAGLIEGARKWQRGEVEEGMKKMLPAIVRGPYLSYLMATQGEKDSHGARIASPEAIKWYMHAGQVLGFRPRVIGQVRRDNYELISLGKDIIDKRFDLLDRLDIAEQHKNWKAYRTTYEEIDKFNLRYPGYEIKTQDMVDSADTRNKKRAQSYKGVEITEKNAPMLGRALVNTRRELSQLEREAKKKKE
jgi:hypothetical protein